MLEVVAEEVLVHEDVLEEVLEVLLDVVIEEMVDEDDEVLEVVVEVLVDDEEVLEVVVVIIVLEVVGQAPTVPAIQALSPGWRLQLFPLL